MANICCDDVYFYSLDNPNGLNALWDDLNKAISFNDPLHTGQHIVLLLRCESSG